MEITTNKEYIILGEDFQDLMDYISEVLIQTYPCQYTTVEHLILGMLELKDCHASTILDNILREETIEELIKYYDNLLRTGYKLHTINKEDNLVNLERFFRCIVKESEKQGNERSDTEHLLLSLVNPENGYSVADKFAQLGVTYKVIQDKAKTCNFISKPAPIDNKPIRKKMEKKIPSKVKTNSKTISVNEPTPFISKYTTNITEEVKDGKYDNVIGRDEVMDTVIKTLAKRKKNNVILVGKQGVGKTSIVYKLASMIESDNVPAILENKQIVKLDTMGIVSGTQLRGMFEERVDDLFKELKSNSNYILFIDDIQSVVRTSNKDKDGDVSEMLSKILTDGNVRVIATTSFKDYRNGIENNSNLSNKFQKVIIEPTSKETTLEILKDHKKYYEDFHRVKYEDSSLTKIIHLADRYITNKSFPDSAIDVLDLSGAAISINNKHTKKSREFKDKIKEIEVEKKEAMSQGDFEKLDEIATKESALRKKYEDQKRKARNNRTTWPKVTEENIADTISQMTNIPVSKLSVSDKESIINMDKILKEVVIGQDESIDEISKAIKRNKAGLGNKNKATVFMLIGKTGSGKTLISKELAKQVYGDEKALIRFDMSEYQDKTSVNKLLGSSAGYVGYENGGLLTEAIKNKPYCVLLFDEIEKADDSIYNVFLQLFDEGRLTDNNGTVVNFKNVIVIMTSNVGAKEVSELGDGVGFQTNSDNNKKLIMNKALKNKFNPEFLNRIDKVLYFNPLTDENIKEICKIEIDKMSDRIEENGIKINYSEDVIDFIYKKAILEKEYGARPIIRLIQDYISDKLADCVLINEEVDKVFNISVNGNGEIEIK